LAISPSLAPAASARLALHSRQTAVGPIASDTAGGVCPYALDLAWLVFLDRPTQASSPALRDLGPDG
jgi:hypothetical protein